MTPELQSQKVLSIPPDRAEAIKARLTARIVINGDCWEIRTKAGYASSYVSTEFATIHASRVAYLLEHGGTLSSTEFICHKCDNPPCVNPAHLFKGTAGDNARDTVAKGRWVGPTGTSYSTIKRGHHSATAKYSNRLAEEVMFRCAMGERQADVARDLGITHSVLNRLRQRAL